MPHDMKISEAGGQWYKVKNENEVFSPALLVYPDRIERNIRRMVEIAGKPSLLRPHVKTHKMPQIIRMQMKHGINKFKCATISETEMVARCGAHDIMLALQPVGPNIERLFRLREEYRDSNISCIADSEPVIRQISEEAVRRGTVTDMWLDINNGMDRTGIRPGEDAMKLYRLMISLPKIRVRGFHVYDGHIHERDFNLRKQICTEHYSPVQKMVDALRQDGITDVTVVAGGSPTFPVHAARRDAECSPGTILLWDFGYSSSFADLDFLHAAVLLARVVSKPSDDMVCLDLGHKAVGSEMPQPRIKILETDDYVITGHNEEHMVARSPCFRRMYPGDTVYALPWHVCPTVDRYDSVYVVTGSEVNDQWDVEARKRKINF